MSSDFHPIACRRGPAHLHLLQRGMTLMEMIASLSVMAVVIVGALALFGSATSSEAAVTMQTNLGALQSATRQLFYGQGTYGADNLNAVLVTARKVPTTVSVNGSALTYRNTRIDVAGSGTTFSVTLTNVPPDLCMALMTGTPGWSSIQGTAGDVETAMPVPPVRANSDCGATGQMVFVN